MGAVSPPRFSSGSKPTPGLATSTGIDEVRLKASHALSVLASATVIVLAYLSPSWIPYCMDEFVHYHPLGCFEFPLSREYNTYREGCGRYDLRLPFTSTTLPLRSYHYIGSLPALPFYPFWKALRDPVAVRVQGAGWLLLAAFLLSRLTATSFGAALAAGLVFPVYAFAFIVDLGPVGLSLNLLLAALLVTRAAVTAARPAPRLALAALAGFVVFLGVWTKLVFVWTVPAIALFAVLSARDAGAPLRSFLKERSSSILAFAAALAIPAALLVFATDVDGSRYYEIVRVGNVSLEPRTWNAAVRIGRYLVDGAAVIPRTLALPSSPLDAVPAVLSAGLIGLALLRNPAAWVARWTALAVMTFGVTVLTRSAWAPHHIAFSIFFLVGALSLAIERLHRTDPRMLAAAFALAALYWGSLAVRLPSARINPDTNSSKDELLVFVRREGLDRTTVQIHTSWGTYYIAHLFGDRGQIVIYVNRLPDLPERVAEVKAIAESTKRGLLVITAREPERFRTPAVRDTLGEPLAEYRFDNWRAVRYLR